jgi:hypothetical protein
VQPADGLLDGGAGRRQRDQPQPVELAGAHGLLQSVNLLSRPPELMPGALIRATGLSGVPLDGYQPDHRCRPAGSHAIEIAIDQQVGVRDAPSNHMALAAAARTKLRRRVMGVGSYVGKVEVGPRYVPASSVRQGRRPFAVASGIPSCVMRTASHRVRAGSPAASDELPLLSDMRGKGIPGQSFGKKSKVILYSPRTTNGILGRDRPGVAGGDNDPYISNG